jgi:hypothetical protein
VAAISVSERPETRALRNLIGGPEGSRKIGGFSLVLSRHLTLGSSRTSLDSYLQGLEKGRH